MSQCKLCEHEAHEGFDCEEDVEVGTAPQDANGHEASVYRPCGCPGKEAK